MFDEFRRAVDMVCLLGSGFVEVLPERRACSNVKGDIFLERVVEDVADLRHLTTGDVFVVQVFIDVDGLLAFLFREFSAPWVRIGDWYRRTVFNLVVRDEVGEHRCTGSKPEGGGVHVPFIPICFECGDDGSVFSSVLRFHDLIGVSSDDAPSEETAATGIRGT